MKAKTLYDQFSAFMKANDWGHEKAWSRFERFYERAAEAKPQDPRVLLGLARVYHELEQYEPARVKYEELAAVDRPLAERYAYLGGGAGEGGNRAAATDNVRRQILWAE